MNKYQEALGRFKVVAQNDWANNYQKCKDEEKTIHIGNYRMFEIDGEAIKTLQELVDKESKNQSELVENILYEFIYLDCNKEINYKNMTGEQVVNDYNKVIERLLNRYNISLDNYYVRSEEDA